jgi:ribosome-associated protein
MPSWRGAKKCGRRKAEAMAKLRLTPSIAIDDSELEERFVLASGPGGQNVNKVETGVQLRFDAAHSAALDDATRARLHALAGRRMTKNGVLVIEATRFRTQERNRDDARQRLAQLLTAAFLVPKPRKRTKPTKASKRKRLEGKVKRGQVKKLRGKPRDY